MSRKQPMILADDIAVSKDDDGRIEFAIPRIRVWSYLDCDDIVIEVVNDGRGGALDHEVPILIEMLSRMAAWRAEYRTNARTEEQQG